VPSRLKEMRIFMFDLVSGVDPRRHPRTHADTFPKLHGPVVTKHVGVDRRRGKAPAERSAVSHLLCDLFDYVGLFRSLFRRRRCSRLPLGRLVLLFWLCLLGAYQLGLGRFRCRRTRSWGLLGLPLLGRTLLRLLLLLWARLRRWRLGNHPCFASGL
jgi:hypothetical protein